MAVLLCNFISVSPFLIVSKSHTFLFTMVALLCVCISASLSLSLSLSIKIAHILYTVTVLRVSVCVCGCLCLFLYLSESDELLPSSSRSFPPVLWQRQGCGALREASWHCGGRQPNTGGCGECYSCFCILSDLLWKFCHGKILYFEALFSVFLSSCFGILKGDRIQ